MAKWSMHSQIWIKPTFLIGVFLSKNIKFFAFFSKEKWLRVQ